MNTILVIDDDESLRDGLLAACWVWIAWAFHYRYYAQIN